MQKLSRYSPKIWLILSILWLNTSYSAIYSDEDVLLFPVNAVWAEDHWAATAHGWIYELEADSGWRNALIGKMLDILGLEEDALENEIFQQRIRMFLVDNQSRKKLTLTVADNNFNANPSARNGHFKGDISIDPLATTELNQTWIDYQVVTRKQDDREFTGHIQLVNPTGLSIVSDIDDTIKFSHVLDKKELLINSFLREFQAIPGMAEFYQRLIATHDDQQVTFHYLSGSPWQLYPFLASFMQQAGFPKGSFHLRLFGHKEKSYQQFSSASQAHKTSHLEQLFQNYPQRQFILVGDSGEHDAEIYADIAKRYPQQVKHIYIHIAEGDNDDPIRFNSVFSELNTAQWTIFTNPTQL